MWYLEIPQSRGLLHEAKQRVTVFKSVFVVIFFHEHVFGNLDSIFSASCAFLCVKPVVGYAVVMLRDSCAFRDLGCSSRMFMYTTNAKNECRSCIYEILTKEEAPYRTPPLMFLSLSYWVRFGSSNRCKQTSYELKKWRSTLGRQSECSIKIMLFIQTCLAQSESARPETNTCMGTMCLFHVACLLITWQREIRARCHATKRRTGPPPTASVPLPPRSLPPRSR